MTTTNNEIEKEKVIHTQFNIINDDEYCPEAEGQRARDDNEDYKEW